MGQTGVENIHTGPGYGSRGPERLRFCFTDFGVRWAGHLAAWDLKICVGDLITKAHFESLEIMYRNSIGNSNSIRN